MKKHILLGLRPALFPLFPIFPLLLLLFLPGCKPCDDPTDPECPNYCVDETNPECPNYDPCWDQTEVSAEFEIIESDRYGSVQVLDTMYYDTFYAGDLITEAIHQHEGWTYRWIIGVGEYDGVSTALDYGSANYGEAVNMTLIVEGPPNTECFPDDDGRDTVTKIIYRKSSSESQMLGTYHGYLNGDATDTVTISFRFHPELVNDPDRFPYQATNLKRGCGWHWYGARTNRTMYFTVGGSVMCDNPRGLLVLDPGKTEDWDSVRIDYSLMDRSAGSTLSDRLNFVFEGRRVQ